MSEVVVQDPAYCQWILREGQACQSDACAGFSQFGVLRKVVEDTRDDFHLPLLSPSLVRPGMMQYALALQEFS